MTDQIHKTPAEQHIEQDPLQWTSLFPFSDGDIDAIRTELRAADVEIERIVDKTSLAMLGMSAVVWIVNGGPESLAADPATINNALFMTCAVAAGIGSWSSRRRQRRIMDSPIQQVVKRGEPDV